MHSTPGPRPNGDEIARAPLPASGFRDGFDRETLGADYTRTSEAWRLVDGRLCGRGARNHPVWLRRQLPTNARIEFDALSRSADGDLKVEAWGDGTSSAAGNSYNDATSYLAILGGWKNTLHVLARLDEHGADRRALPIDPTGLALDRRPVVPNQEYHCKLERADGRTLRWLVDDIELVSFEDPAPLVGARHAHFAFNDWETEVCFDNLVITPL